MTGVASVFDLDRLIHPISPQTFRRKYWEKRPLLVARKRPTHYAGLLSIGDVDHILATSSIRSSDVRLVKDGRDIALDTLKAGQFATNAVMLDVLYSEYRNGATIVLQFLHERCKPLGDLTLLLAREFSAAVQVNVYLTPPNERGLGLHYDTHDVLVLQAEGYKLWRVGAGGPMKLPLNGQPYITPVAEKGEKVHEFELHAGDLLYVPRGFMHEAVCKESTSLHLTVGIKTITWAHLMRSALESRIEEDPELRASLPPAFARNARMKKHAEVRLARLLDAVRAKTDPVGLIRHAAEVARRGTREALKGHLLDLTTSSKLTGKTRVARRGGMDARLVVEDDSACLYFRGKEIRMPSYVAPDLRYMLTGAEFQADELPGELDEPGRLTLIRRLIQEGFLAMREHLG
jgi:ribosomal protein L16 Arg81 hydroxylase